MKSNERPVIRYGGDKTNELLKQGRKIVTLRKPAEKYNIPVGAAISAECFDANETVPSVVIANDTRALNQFPDPTLLLDGYALPEIAAQDLASWYDGTTVDSPMQRIATLPDGLWNSLSQSQQEKLLGIGLDEALKVPEFRRIFMPSLLHWFLTYGNATYENWHGWLNRQGLISEDEIEAKTLLDADTEYFYIDSLFALGGMAAILNHFDPNSPEYRNLILHEPVSVPFE